MCGVLSLHSVYSERERFLEANKKCVRQSDLRSAACRLPAGAGVGTVAEMVFEGVEYVIRLASGAGAARVAVGGGVVGGAVGRLALVAPDALCEGAGVVVVVLERRVGSAPCDLVGRAAVPVEGPFSPRV